MAAKIIKPRVIVTHRMPDAWLKPVIDSCDVSIGPGDQPGVSEELQAILGEAEGILTLLTDRIDRALLDRAPRLKVVSNMAVGFDNIDLADCTRRGIPVGNTPGGLTDATADMTMTLLLAVSRQLVIAAEDARNGKWHTWMPAGWLGADLNGATLGIIGFGRIGKAVAARAKGFGMKIVYTNLVRETEMETTLGARAVDLEELLRISDFITLHVPLTPDTRLMIRTETLEKMKPTAYLVNIARGGVVHTEDLYKALKEGWIAGAALDVTDPEPLPAKHPLYSLPNCLIVPHIGSATVGTRGTMAHMAVENLMQGLAGKRLPYCVNPEVYERKAT